MKKIAFKLISLFVLISFINASPIINKSKTSNDIIDNDEECADFLMPHPECNEYIKFSSNCKQGRMTKSTTEILTCEKPLLFNNKTKHCDQPENVKCQLQKNKGRNHFFGMSKYSIRF
jgi:hypothetical protein